MRVGYLDGQIVINPTNSQRDLSDLDLVVAGTEDAIVMVEAGAREVDESVVLDAFEAAHAAIRQICQLQRQFRDIHVVTQHMMVAPATLEVVGRILLGLDADTSTL